MGFSHEVSNIASGLEAIRFHLEGEKEHLSASGQVAAQQLGVCIDRLFAWQEVMRDYQAREPSTQHTGPLREVLTGLGWTVLPSGIEPHLADRPVYFDARWIADTRWLFANVASEAVRGSSTLTHAVLHIRAQVAPPLGPEEKMRRAVARAYYKWMGGALLPEAEGWQVELRLKEPKA